MLKLLLDEHISPKVAKGLRLRPSLVVHSIVEWQGGKYRGTEDALILHAALGHGLTLVTYDQKTIATLVAVWAENGFDHAGVIFVDDRTVAQENIGGIIRSLEEMIQRAGDWDWANLCDFLRP